MREMATKSGKDALCRAPSPHHQSLNRPPSPSPRLPPWQNHPQYLASNSVARSVVSCQAKSKPRATGTRGGVLFVGWLASNGTIAANPRRRCGDHIFALVPEDLERFVEDRTQLREDRATANAMAFLVFYLRLFDAHSIQFRIDVVPSQRHRFRRCMKPTVAT